MSKGARFGIWKYSAKQSTTFICKATGKEVDAKEVYRLKWVDAMELYQPVYATSGRELYGIIWTEPNGRVRRERSGLSKTLARTEVERKRKQVQEAKVKGFDTVEGPKAAITLKQAGQEYIDGQKNQDTKGDYQDLLDRVLVPVLGNVVLGIIKPADVMGLIEKRIKDGVQVGTVKKALAVLSGIFSTAMAKDLVDRNPVTAARKGKRAALKQGTALVRFLSQAEEVQLMAALPPRKAYYANGTNVNGSCLRDAVPFAIMTGLRRTEQLQLVWKDYDPARRVIRIMKQKNGNQDEVALCDSAVAILERLRLEAMTEGEGRTPAALAKLAIFRDPETGKPLTRFHNTGWINALVKSGIEDFRWHDCRHTFASRLALGSVSPGYAQRMMRHGGAEMTARYTHLVPEDNTTGIDFQGRKGVQVLDCFQDYPALLGITVARTSPEVLPARQPASLHA